MQQTEHKALWWHLRYLLVLVMNIRCLGVGCVAAREQESGLCAWAQPLVSASLHCQPVVSALTERGPNTGCWRFQLAGYESEFRLTKLDN